MLLQPLLEDVPNTVNYLVLGYVFLIGLPLLYLGSLVYRRRNLQRDMELIRSLEKEEKPGQTGAQGGAQARRADA